MNTSIMTNDNNMNMAEQIASINRTIGELKRVSEKNAASIDTVKASVEEHTNRFAILDKEMNVLGSVGRFSRMKRRLADIVKASAMRACGGHGTDEYILFYRSFSADIHRKIRQKLDVAGVDYISMVDYENPESPYQTALNIAREWTPSQMLINNKVADFLAESKDNKNWSKLPAFQRYVANSFGI